MKKKISLIICFAVFAAAISVHPQARPKVDSKRTRLASSTLASSQQAPRRGFPQSGNFRYALMTAIAPSNVTNDDVKRYYDFWKKKYLVKVIGNAGENLYRVRHNKSGSGSRETVSEGQGYGMIIVALMAGYEPEAKKIFDGLWNFSQKHPSNTNTGRTKLMAWTVVCEADERRCERIRNGNSAFDGDADIAYALLLADRQWGSNGAVNYKARAVELIKDIYVRTVGQTSKLPMLGDWVDKNSAPTAANKYNQYTARTSDFMINHFRAFGKADLENDWKAVVDKTQNAIDDVQSRLSPRTGLLPDFLEAEQSAPNQIRFRTARNCFLEKEIDGTYNYNACRVPFRLGVDALLYAQDQRSLAQVGKIAGWFEMQGKRVSGGRTEYDAQLIKNGYRLDGEKINMEAVLKCGCVPGARDSCKFLTTVTSSAFLAPLAVAAMTQPGQQDWLNELSATVKTVNPHEDYYEHTLSLLCLLVLTGNFWSP